MVAVQVFRQTRPLPDLGSEHDLCRRGGQPLGLGSSGIQDVKRMLEDRCARPVVGEIQTDAAGIAGNNGGQFQEFAAQRGHLCAGQRRAWQCQCSQAFDQRIGQCREQDSKLIGIEVVATGARGKQA